MEASMMFILSMFTLFFSLASCHEKGNVRTTHADESGKNVAGKKLAVKIGSNTFYADLEDNPTTTAFIKLLPFTVSMKEHNGNEKYAELSENLVTNASNPGTIQNGDLMLYGSNTLVLFYKSFPTSYSYTKIGKISNPAVLAAAVGSGNVSVTFEQQ